MLDKIGEEFDGMISSVTNFGMFVELPNTIEGLVHVSFMTDDYYRFDEQHFAMIGERTGNVFRIGDEITVKVVDVNKDERNIDFEIVGMKGTPRRPRELDSSRSRKRGKPARKRVQSTNTPVSPAPSEEKGEWFTKPKKKKKNAASRMLRNRNGKEEIAAQPANRAAALYLLSFGNSFSL